MKSGVRDPFFLNYSFMILGKDNMHLALWKLKFSELSNILKGWLQFFIIIFTIIIVIILSLYLLFCKFSTNFLGH